MRPADDDASVPATGRATEAARLVIDPAFTVGAVDERLFGSFVEHLGRVVYGGIFEPGHPAADADGWRRDVLDMVRELGVTLIRYPGGNFVSGYDWEDGVGPRHRRPTRLELAWHSLEDNAVGTDEFLAWAKLAGITPMLTVNLGTRGVDAARSLVEYCNGEPGTRYADLRVANGHADPYGVRTWCLGNELDGPWTIGQKTAEEYGRLAAEAGKAMKLADPSIELVLAGSSGPQMPTFGRWDDTVLDLAWDVTDYLSVHSYLDRADHPDVDSYLAGSLAFDRMIATICSTADAVAGRRRSRKRVPLSLDEWNVWHHAENPPPDGSGPFRRAPAIGEDEHDLADALVVGCLLITLLRHADRVRIACLSQLVNAIAPIRTLDGGPAWRQATFFPFRDVARHGRGTVLRVEPDGPTYRVDGAGDGPALEAAAVLDAAGPAVTLFLVNRRSAALPVRAVLRDLGPLAIAEHAELTGSLTGSNSAIAPAAVAPARGRRAHVRDGVLTADLPGRSWTTLRLTRAGHGSPATPQPHATTARRSPA
jgi:alpha-N-arabinofuranosidase